MEETDIQILKERLKALIMIHDYKKIRAYVLSKSSCTNALHDVIDLARVTGLPFADAVRKLEYSFEWEKLRGMHAHPKL
jgi:hypothetical protein